MREVASGRKAGIRHAVTRPTIHCPPPMFSVSREIDFCYGHRLLDYQGKCRHLHGHNGRALITVEAAGLDQRGMVLDFAEIRRTVQQWIDENLDHRMILHRDDPIVPVLEEAGQPVYLLDDNPTAENIARLIFDVAAGRGYGVVEVRFWETAGCFASYRPSATSTAARIGRERPGQRADSSRKEEAP